MAEEKQGRLLPRVSRRSFLKGVGTGVAGSAVISGTAVLDQPAEAQGGAGGIGPGPVPVTLNINGKEVRLQLEPRTTLLSALRNHMPPNQALTGAKPGCEEGACGACSVLIDGTSAYSCLMLAVDAQGKKITTVEGLERDGKLSPVQQAMVENDGYMCGFCTPGFVISITSLLNANPNPTLAQVKEGLSGNLCRCGAYDGIFKATLAAAARQRRG
jgi:xanthine dehydrogenase YagT iron-sulfur-binding subunit